jgi:hypothetical protein
MSQSLVAAQLLPQPVGLQNNLIYLVFIPPEMQIIQLSQVVGLLVFTPHPRKNLRNQLDLAGGLA